MWVCVVGLNDDFVMGASPLRGYGFSPYAAAPVGFRCAIRPLLRIIVRNAQILLIL